MPRIVAFYLPQYHPIPENDTWYGKGFTEWRNVAKAKPLFRGHYQPHIPADLGFYDLRLPETRREQSELAQKYGINAFCYWFYWFGAGDVLLENPIWWMLNDKMTTIPFCIGWANHSWSNKLWDSKGNNQLLKEQKYLGNEDYERFFYYVLPLLKDDRYFRVHNKPLVYVYKPLDSAEIKSFVSLWDELAKKEGLNGIYFVGEDRNSENISDILENGFDAVCENNTTAIHHYLSLPEKVWLYITREWLKRPTVFQYKDAIRFMVPKETAQPNVIPSIAPNWDHSPRTGRSAILLNDCKPEYFEQAVRQAFRIVSNKDAEEQLVFIKSWNEWGEGNHLEPDCKYGLGYLEAIRKVRTESENNDVS